MLVFKGTLFIAFIDVFSRAFQKDGHSLEHGLMLLLWPFGQIKIFHKFKHVKYFSLNQMKNIVKRMFLQLIKYFIINCYKQLTRKSIIIPSYILLVINLVGTSNSDGVFLFQPTLSNIIQSKNAYTHEPTIECLYLKLCKYITT